MFFPLSDISLLRSLLSVHFIGWQFKVLCLAVCSSEPFYTAAPVGGETRLGEDNKGHQLLTKMGEWGVRLHPIPHALGF